jgi:hypothetical protein
MRKPRARTRCRFNRSARRTRRRHGHRLHARRKDRPRADGSSANGAASYQLDLTHPVHVDEIDASCNNGSSNCNFSLAVLGNSTGN